jgi:hypothetical protein
MPLIGRLLLGLAATSTHLFAFGIILLDPTFGLSSDPVFGDPLKYAIQDASLLGPSSGAGPFILTVDTNYGGSLPGSPDLIPAFTEQGFATLWMGDFLIQQGGLYYGVVLSPHDGYAAGDVYLASGFQNSVYFNPGVPVSLLPGGVLIGSGTLSAAPNTGCNGVNCAEFRVTDTFNINPPFTFIDENAPFTVLMSSATCANGLLFETEDEVPETATSWLMGLGLAGLLTRIFRSNRRPAVTKA